MHGTQEAASRENVKSSRNTTNDKETSEGKAQGGGREETREKEVEEEDWGEMESLFFLARSPLSYFKVEEAS